MHLNYTRRLILAVGGYTFFFTLLVTGSILFWQELDDHEEARVEEFFAYSVEQILPALQGNNSGVIKASWYDIYLPGAELPDFLKKTISGLPSGFHLIDKSQSVYIGHHPDNGEPYYFLMRKDNAGSFSFYVKGERRRVHEGHDEDEEHDDGALFVILTIIIPLIVIAAMTLLARRMASPVLELKQQIDNIDIHSGSIPELDRDDEVGELADSFGNMLTRVRKFIKREQDFTRYASHELRSPVTIMRGNMDLMLQGLPDTELNQRVSKRMSSAINRMSLIIESFLWMSREEEDSNEPFKQLDRNDVDEIMQELALGYSDHEIERLSIHLDEDIEWYVRPNFLIILADNLVRNALRHSSEKITITTSRTTMVVQNKFSPSQRDKGDGIGLEIIERLCQSQNWQYRIEQSDGEFHVIVIFGS